MKAKTDVSLSQAAKGKKATGGSAPEKKAREREATAWEDRVTRQEKQSALKLGLQAARQDSDERVARVEALRAQVQAGTYQVDCLALARCMLAQEPGLREYE